MIPEPQCAKGTSQISQLNDAEGIYRHCMMLCESGDSKHAMQLIHHAIKKKPENALYYFALGNVYRTLGMYSKALQTFKKSVSLKPDFVEAINNLGIEYKRIGSLEKAAQHIEKAVCNRPDFPEAYNNLGNIYHQKGEPAKAMACYRKAIKQQADYATAYDNLGRILLQSGQIKAALNCFSQVLLLKPNSVKVLLSIAIILRNIEETDLVLPFLKKILQIEPNHYNVNCIMGDIYREKEKFKTAMRFYKHAIIQNPTGCLFNAYFGLGCCQQELENLEAAICTYENALEHHPKSENVLNNLGYIHEKRHQYNIASIYYQQAIELKPDFEVAHSNIGSVYLDTGDVEKAIFHLEKAVTLNPHNVRANYTLSLGLLLCGKYINGWEKYEYRFQVPDLNLGSLLLDEHRYWGGQPLKERNLLVRDEQGFGDTFQFIRYLPILRNMGAKVVFETEKPLSVLLKGLSGVKIIKTINVPESNAGFFDFYVPMMSIPRIIDPSMKNIPDNIKYLNADAALVDKWKPVVDSGCQFKIGLNWQGNPKFKGDQRRSIPLKYFFKLGRLDSVRLFSMQKHHGVEQLANLPNDVKIKNLGAELDETGDAFIDTAAVLMNLDLLITSDTAIAHLAGALGRPVWVLLPFVPEWRWGLRGETSLWYPTMRLFRQQSPGDWPGVIIAVIDAVKAILSIRKKNF